MISRDMPKRAIGRLQRPFGDLHYEVSGGGPALLFAHGLGGKQYDAWLKDAEAKLKDGVARGIHPAMGFRAAERAPALHLLYRNIDEMAGLLDKEKLRAGLRRTASRSTAELKSFNVPTLLIAGGQDVVFPSFLASAIAATLPCGEAALMADAGHSPYFEEAATFDRLVETFLARQR